MKTLDEIEKNIIQLKEQILCQEIGNDSYYLSPLYHEQLIKLEALEREADVLKGKALPLMMDFEKYPPEKSILLQKIAKENDLIFANNYKDLSTDELIFLYNLIKKNNKTQKNAGQ